MSKFTEKDLLRLSELELKAKDRFVENSDYRPEEWLDNEKEVKEYKKLFQKFLTSLEEV